MFTTSLLLISCYEKNATDAVKTYEYWAEAKPPADMELFNGQYWQSAHWTKEYIMYLKFKPSKEWVTAFLSQNGFSVDTTKWTKPDDMPDWFIPSINSNRYKIDDFNQSEFFCDWETGICYLYEIQL
jgi:hypothetical protein